MADPRGYRPIADYAAIGDCHGGALVASDGGIDWACFDRFDADPVLCRVLDARRGGHFTVTPAGEHTATRAYLPGTNILRTVFKTAGGEAAVTDFMAVGRRPGSGPNDYVSLNAPGWLVRRIEGVAGEAELRVACSPTLGHGERFAAFRPAGVGRFAAPEGLFLSADVPLQAAHGGVEATVRVRAGERRFVALGSTPPPLAGEALEQCFRTTRAFWQEWIAYCRYAGPYTAQVERSALALKLMTYPRTGACVAAFTTSLPEWIGGERNWDYRFCWIRDASLMLHALAGIGYAGEGHSFMSFLCDRLGDGVEKLQVMYGIGGDSRLTERVIGHLEGYRGSRPVRAGNAAFFQDQIDLYGYILEGACVYEQLGGRLPQADREAFTRVVDFIDGCWTRADTGIWEMRGPPRHFVHSKAMCWLVVDRGIRLFGHRPAWSGLRERIRESILREGRHADGHLLQSLGAEEASSVDAALLQLPALGFPLDPQTLHRTRLAVERVLARGDLVQRYRSADGVHGPDGAFLACSFWLVDALLAEGEEAKATALFERLLARANDVGLYSEEVDPGTGELLGNFPQAFTHFALVNSAVSLDLFRRKGGARALDGGYAGRAHRSIGASVGWRGVLAALRSTGRIRMRSSRASILDMGTPREDR